MMIKKIKAFIRKLGPGIITGASDDDPSGIGTYSQTGAKFGYDQLWLSPISCIFAIAIQEMCGRIGLVTGKGLTGIMRENFPKGISYAAIALLFFANTVNIGADLGAMAAAAQLVFGLPFVFWILAMTTLTLILEIFLDYRVYSKVLIFLSFSLFAYFATAIIVKQDLSGIFQGTFLPHVHFSKESILNIVAFLGTTISPYLFFWQAAEEVEEEIVDFKVKAIGSNRPRISHLDIKSMRIDTVIGMFFASLTAFMIVITTAGTLHQDGITSINSATDAAQALRPLAGDFAYLLFAIGIIGTGLLGVPVLAGSSSYAISETFGWKAGLGKKLKEAPGFYGSITIATVIGLAINFIGIDPMQALYYAAAVNGLMAPPLMILILLIANKKTVMGHYTNKWLSNTVCIITTVVMASAGILLLFNL